MKTVEREEARRLRRDEGLSVKELASLLGVSKSSVSLWVRDIELTDEQRAVLRDRMRTGCAGASWFVAQAQERRRQAQEQGREIARRGNPLHAAGCMLYWAEGSRTRNAIRFTNSDPEMIRFFARFLRGCFDVPDERFRITCNLFADHATRQVEIEQFWLDLLRLPRTCLCKSSVNVYSRYSKKKRRNKLPYGTCRVAVHDTYMVQSIYGAIQEYAGFNREEWLM
jgi:transcriptional regulator with XRE-family HTH domain